MNIQTLIQSIGTVVNSLIGIMVALAVAVFFWGLVIFIFKSGNEKSHTEGKNRMIWGTVALFVMVSVWGIINFVSSDLGITTSSAITNPQHPVDTGTPCDGTAENPCL